MSKVIGRRRPKEDAATARARLFERGRKGRMGAGTRLQCMTNEYEDVLQNIEFVLVEGYRKDRSIDDIIVAEALSGALRGKVPAGERSGHLAEKLAGVRQVREDVPGNVWHSCLRTVLQSLRRHSNGRRGNRGYLRFAEGFFP